MIWLGFPGVERVMPLLSLSILEFFSLIDFSQHLSIRTDYEIPEKRYIHTIISWKHFIIARKNTQHFTSRTHMPD